MKKIFAKLIGCMAAAGMSMILGVFPAMAQEEILINPNALQKLQSSAPVEGGIYSITVSAGELFTGIPSGGCTVTQLVDQMNKYPSPDWTILGKGDLTCFFESSGGSLLFTFENYGSYRYTGNTSGLSRTQKTNLERETGNQMWISPGSTIVTIDGYNMNNIINQILSANTQYTQASNTQTDNSAANTSTAANNTVLPTAGWRLDAFGWWYDNGNGTWPANGWQWIDGNLDGIAECYYFTPNGYILMNTLTPDGYWVDGNGAWVQDGIIQIRLQPAA